MMGSNGQMRIDFPSGRELHVKFTTEHGAHRPFRSGKTDSPDQLYAQWFYSDQGDTWLGPCGSDTQYGDNYRWFHFKTGGDYFHGSPAICETGNFENSLGPSGFYNHDGSNFFAATGWSSGIKVSRLLPCLPAVMVLFRAFVLFRLFAVLPPSSSPRPPCHALRCRLPLPNTTPPPLLSPPGVRQGLNSQAALHWRQHAGASGLCIKFHHDASTHALSDPCQCTYLTC
jgi:hypothetical protein